MAGLEVNNMTRAQVAAAVRAIPPGGDFVWDGIIEDERPATEAEMKAGIEADKRRRGRPAGSDKTQIALRVDNDTLEAFRATGQGWQSRMNAVLGEWVRSSHG
jgi:uncharacterized protein (DUF4415 family)